MVGSVRNADTLPPWSWRLVQMCMDLHTGTMHQWPLPGGYRANGRLLEAMRATWRAWVFARKPASQWDETDLQYKDWLDEGREQERPLSDFEKWQQAQERPDGG